MKRKTIYTLNLASIAFAMLAFFFSGCRKPIKNTERNPAPMLQSHFDLNAENHPTLVPLIFSDMTVVGDYLDNGEQVVVFFNQLAKEVIYYKPNSDTILKQFNLPEEAQGRWPISNFKVLGKDSLLYFNTNNQKICVLSGSKTVAEFDIPSPSKNEPNSIYSNGSIQGTTVNNWVGLKAYANYDGSKGQVSDSLVRTQNLYSFFNINADGLQVKSYPVKQFNNKNQNFNSRITFNTTLNRIDYYYSFSDTVQSYYLKSGKIETNIISKTKYPATFEGISENRALSRIIYDTVSNYYVRRIARDTLLPNQQPSSNIHLEILNDDFETLNEQFVFTGQTPTNLVLLSDGVYFGRLDKKRKLWYYHKLVYPS